LDESRSGPAREIWFVGRAHKFVFNQAGSQFTLEADGSIADVVGPLVYSLDGSEITTINHSIGDIPGWTRKIRTKAMMDGTAVETHTSHVSEMADRAGVTVVLKFTLLPDGRSMTVERSGFRPVPPPMLHGRPYRQEDDLLYRKDTAIYVRAVDQEKTRP
jgi:hypothetical protein